MYIGLENNQKHVGYNCFSLTLPVLLWRTFFQIGNLSKYKKFDGKTRLNIYWKGATIQRAYGVIMLHRVFPAGDIYISKPPQQNPNLLNQQTLDMIPFKSQLSTCGGKINPLATLFKFRLVRVGGLKSCVEQSSNWKMFMVVPRMYFEYSKLKEIN